MSDDYVDVYGMFVALSDEIAARNSCSAYIRATCHDEKLQATAYAWGREDAGETPIREAYGRQVNAPWEFGYMYGIVCLMYQLEMIYMKPSIRNAWNAFRASRDITDYVHE